MAATGVVLIGEAAGYSSPITGQGLSLAFADACDVASSILTGPFGAASFEDYGRRKRHRLDVVRFASEVTAAVSAERCPDRSRRIGDQQLLLTTDDRFRQAIEAEFAGPDSVPPGELRWDQLHRIRTA